MPWVFVAWLVKGLAFYNPGDISYSRCVAVFWHIPSCCVWHHNLSRPRISNSMLDLKMQSSGRRSQTMLLFSVMATIR